MNLQDDVVVTLCDLTHDLDLGYSKLNFEITISEESLSILLQCKAKNFYHSFVIFGGGRHSRGDVRNWHRRFCHRRSSFTNLFCKLILGIDILKHFLWNCSYRRWVPQNPIHNKSAVKKYIYRQVSNIRRISVGNQIVDHSDVVGASPVGAAPTTSSFST